MQLTGACLCGSITYKIYYLTSDVVDYCHCRQCRRASGAPVTAWVELPPARFHITQGAPRPYPSSARATRWFCPDCGTQLYMTDNANTSVGVPLGTLDTPEAIRPTVHGWTSEQLTWFQLKDDLPRHPQAPPYDF